MSSPANIASQPNQACASSGATDLTGSFRRRPMYTWLEQGRGGAPSADVLDRIARAPIMEPMDMY
jgi:hypothetical protein